MNKLRILYDLIMGLYFKSKAWICITCNIKPKISRIKAENTIVSLTSYGDRLSRCAPYAIYSMFTQNVTPEKITLWIDKYKWNDSNIPFFIRRMKGWGILEINYCEDIRSYTKLLPALQKYSEKIIITIDDDLYYSKSFIKELYEPYLKKRDNIYTYGVNIPTFYKNELLPYSDWKVNLYKQKNKIENNKNILAYGFCGILYPPGIFDDEIFNRHVYMKYCVTCDDIWFYIMSLRMGINKTLINSQTVHFYLIDLIYQKTNRKSCLRDINSGSGKNNDIALSNLLSYYKLKIEL